MSSLFGSPEPTPEPVAAARRTDPATSHIAAAEVERSGSASDQRAIVLAAVREGPGRTSGEMASRLTLDSVQCSRRLPELEKAGLIRRGDARPCKIKGKQMLTWWAVVGSEGGQQ